MIERRKVLNLFDEQEDVWQVRVRKGIEQYRKGTADITLTDQNGCGIPNARIRVKQTSHEFRFGANLFMLDEFETEEKNQLYKSYFSDVFNMATLPFYWDATEPEKGKQRYAKDSSRIYRRPAIDLCMEFCLWNGIEPREHALAYERFFPKWLYGASSEEVKRELERRYSEIAERYADRIRTIEVTNEMSWEKGRTQFYDASEFVEWCFRLAERYFPKNQLCINDWTGMLENSCGRATDQYYAYIEANLLKGARIDAIGMQYHLFHSVEEEYEKTRLTLNPERIYRNMDLYSEFGKPLQITEVTVPAYSWNPEDEEVQAEIIEKLYSVWFSHPNVEQIIYWNLVDGYAHVATADPQQIRASMGNMTLGENVYYGGLLRFDLSPKPAYYKIKELIRKRWHTEEELTTDACGAASFKGFYGHYDVEILIDGKWITKGLQLSKHQENRFSLTI